MATKSRILMTISSVDPLDEVTAAGELVRHLRRAHGSILFQILGLLPFEVLPTIFCVWLPAKVAVRSCHLVLRLPQRQGLGDRARPRVEVDLDDAGDVLGCQSMLLCAVGLDKQG